jgi:Tfp pilus assembly protein PilN
MGFLWDLVQHSQIEEQSKRAGTLEARVAQLEGELHQVRQMLHEALRRLEQRFGEDLNGDNRIG